MGWSSLGLGLGGLGVYWSYRVVYERALDFKRGLDQRSFLEAHPIHYTA